MDEFNTNLNISKQTNCHQQPNNDFNNGFKKKKEMESSGSAMVRKIGKILWYTFKLRTFSI